jgi:hypothetical protein
MDSDDLRKWATKSHGSERLSAMVRMAKSDQQMWSEYKDFDKDPFCSTSPTATWILGRASSAAQVRPLRPSAAVGEADRSLHAVRRERSDGGVLAPVSRVCAADRACRTAGRAA